MRILSLNVEGVRHLDRVTELITREQPVVVCLQEAPESYLNTLEQLGYTHTFAPLTLRDRSTEREAEGVVFAHREEATQVAVHYYYQPSPTLETFVKERHRETIAHAVISGEVAGIHIATTHFTWTPSGEVACNDQKTDARALLDYCATLPPHILCGDMNIPRHHNELYQRFTEHYTDAVPTSYKSSLDKTLHKLGTSPSHTHLFESFMVDYLFTQAPYIATNVRLIFGVSDHAAVCGDITRTEAR